ncbi:MAG: histidinol-phosphatase HisJ family protein [Filifactoraceae bacterium]
MYLSDYHTHSSFSIDSKTSMEDMIKSGIEKGLNEYCITDHLDTFDSKSQLKELFPIDSYYSEFMRLKNKYKDAINLKLGIEFGLEPSIKNEFIEFSKALPFDFIIGSTHNVDFKDLVSGVDFFNKYTQHDYYEMYLERLYMAASMYECFDVMGHFDYVVRYVPYKDKLIQYSIHSKSIDKVLKKLIENNRGIEINTAGLRYKLSFCHPHIDILKRYKELGGEILTIGSDCHRPESVAEFHNEGISLALETGFKYYTRFEKREPIFENLKIF